MRALSGEEFPDNDELRVAWRLYFIAQFWRAALEILPQSEQRDALDGRLARLGIIYRESTAFKTAFASALAKARALKQLKLERTKGLSLEFPEESLKAGGSSAAIPFNELMVSINSLLESNR